MFKKHRTLLIALLIVIVGMFACCIYLENYYTSREASAQVNGYRIDFKYDFDMEFAETILKITRSDGRSAEVMWRMQRSTCSKLTLLQVDTKIYFACSGAIISTETQYLDTETMLLYDREGDDTPTPIDSLDFR